MTLTETATDNGIWLDIDFHDRPAPATVRGDLLSPTPARWHRSRGGGLHAEYRDLDGYQARELAAAAAIRARDLWPGCGVELLRAVWPGGADTTETPDTACSASWWGPGEDGDATPQLAPGRYGHDSCPWDPDASPDGNPSVVASETGIVCYRCRRRATWGELAATTGHAAREMAWRLVWAGHAATWLAAREAMDLDIARAAYAALMRSLHGPDHPGVRAALGRDLAFYRDGGGRIRRVSDGGDVSREVRKVFFSRIPSYKTYHQDEEGNWQPPHTDLARWDQLLSAEPVSWCPAVETEPGYPWHQWTEGQTAWLPREGWRYRSETERIDPWPVIERWFPGVDRDYLTLLVAAIGHAALRSSGRVPIIVATGCTKAGKTATARLASTLTGGSQGAVVSPGTGRGEFSRALSPLLIGAAPVIVLDEYVRDSAADAPIRLIELQSPYTCRLLYEDECHVPVRSAIVATGPSLPASWSDNAQLAGRMLHVRLPQSQVNWTGAESAGVLDRWHEDRTRHLAAESLCSMILDTYLSDAEHVTLQDVVADLATIQEDQAGDPDLFARWLRALEACPEDPHKPGRRIMSPEDDAGQLWATLCGDDPEAPGDAWYSGERVLELPLRDMLGVEWPIHIGLYRRGRRLAVRVSDTPPTRGLSATTSRTLSEVLP